MDACEDLGLRLSNLLGSPSLLVVPVGDLQEPGRGILSVAESGMGRLGAAVKLAFAGVVVAAALGAASPSQAAGGVGSSADVYGQSERQVMQQGSATRMTVINVRPVEIETAQQRRSGASQVSEYAVTGAGGGVGAIVGRALGGKSAAGQQIGTILGGLAGAIAGNLGHELLQGNQGPVRIGGVELTMLDPVTNRIAVVTQAGNQVFHEGDPVLVVSTGGAVRVVADRGRAIGQDQQRVGSNTGLNEMGTRAPLQGNALERAVEGVVRSARSYGLQVDANKVASVLETGVGEREGQFIGKIVAVDAAHGVVLQSTGRGMGAVHSMSALDRVPAIGEMATIQVRDGLGTVEDRHGQSVAMRGR